MQECYVCVSGMVALLYRTDTNTDPKITAYTTVHIKTLWLMVTQVRWKYRGKSKENTKRCGYTWAYLAAGPKESSLWRRQRCLSVWLPDHPTLWHRLYNSHKLSSQTLQNHNHRYYLIHTKIRENHMFIQKQKLLPFHVTNRIISNIRTLFPVHVGVRTHPPGTLSGRPLLTQLAP